MKKVTIRSKIVGREGSGTGIPSPSSPSAPVDLSLYLKKEVWDDAFELKETEDGVPFLFGKLPVLLQYGLTMYADPGNVGVPSLFDGIPIDNNTIYWEETTNADGSVARVLKAKIGTGEGGSATLLGDLENVGAWANALAEEDRIMVQKKGASSWTSLLLSEIQGTASFENVKESGEGNAYTSIVLSEDKKTLTLNKGESFAKQTDYEALNTKVTDFLEGSDTDNIINKWKELEAFLDGMSESSDLSDILSGKADKATTLSGYGITDAKISNGVITLGANTITPLTAHQTIYNLTFQAGAFSAKTFDPNGAAQTVNIPTKTSHIMNDSNFITPSYVDGTFVTIAGNEDVTGVHNFTNGLKVGGIKMSKSQSGVVFLEGNLVVSGAVTMFGTDSVTASTVMDGVMVDGTTIRKNPTTGKLEVIGGTGGGLDENALANYLTTNKYLTQTTGDTRYVTALGINGNNLTWTKNGVVNNITVPYATTAKELTSYSAITFSKSDNSGKPCYLLIADVTSWYNASSGAVASGIVGFVYGYRDGATPAYSMNVAARCAYGKGYYSLNSSLTSIIEPRVVSYNSKYYLALYLQGSNRTFNFIGRKDNLLSSFTELKCSDGNGTYSGLSVIYKGSATGTSLKADILSTSRTISIMGHATGSGSFDGSSDLGINVAIPTRNVYINGTGYTVHSTITTDTTGVYAPTSGGTSGYVLKANGATYIPTWVAQSSLSVGTASKLSTVSKTAWGQTYWTSGGVPTSISGNMTGVGSITMSGSINYNDYTIFRYSESAGEGGVSTGASLLGSPSLATTLRSSGNDLYHWNAANSAKYLIFDTNNFTNYTNKALTKKNSGTNLLTDGDKYIGAQAYLMGYYTYDSSVTNGVKYRCTLCGKLGDNNTHIAAYWDGGSGNNTTISGLSSTEERTISFTATITNKQRLAFYQFPNGKFGSYIKWCKLEVEEDVTGDTSTYLYNIDRIDFANDSNSHNFGIDRNGTVYGYNVGVLKLRRGKSSGGSYVQYEANNQAVYGWRVGANDRYNFSWWYYDTSSSTDVQKMYLDTSGNLLVTGGITMYSDERKKTILRDVELSLDEVAKAPLIEHYYNSDGKKTTHVGSIAQYWAGLNDWFCKKDSDGYYTMEIQNVALASAISVARELSRFESDTDKRIRLLEEENKKLKEEIEQLKTT